MLMVESCTFDTGHKGGVMSELTMSYNDKCLEQTMLRTFDLLTSGIRPYARCHDDCH